MAYARSSFKLLQPTTTLNTTASASANTRNQLSMILVSSKKGWRKAPRRRLITISTSHGKYDGEWSCDYTLSLKDLQLQDLVEYNDNNSKHHSDQVSINLCIHEDVKDTIWLFEQEQALGFSSVSTNIRMTVIKLKSGGLWVHAPIAPTKECIQLVKELGAPVEYIVLPTFAYEHKIFVGPFSRKFPKAQIWVAPRQWSWPLNLPLEFFGIFRAKTLKDGDLSTPWGNEIEQKVLSSPEVGIGPYVEVAFYHKRSKTLLVTDAVIFVPKRPPDCIGKEFLLASAKNGLAVKILSKGKKVSEEPVVDNEMTRQKGWERMVLQILFLGPSNLLEPNASFAQMSQKLIVSPIVKTLVFSKVPEKVRDWIDAIVRDWKFKRIIPAHFAAPINAGSSEFLAAFAFLDDLLEDRYITRPSLSLLLTSLLGKAASYFPPDDMKTLSSLDDFLVSVGAVKKTVSSKKR